MLTLCSDSQCNSEEQKSSEWNTNTPHQNQQAPNGHRGTGTSPTPQRLPTATPRPQKGKPNPNNTEHGSKTASETALAPEAMLKEWSGDRIF